MELMYNVFGLEFKDSPDLVGGLLVAYNGDELVAESAFETRLEVFGALDALADELIGHYSGELQESGAESERVFFLWEPGFDDAVTSAYTATVFELEEHEKSHLQQGVKTRLLSLETASGDIGDPWRIPPSLN